MGMSVRERYAIVRVTGRGSIVVPMCMTVVKRVYGGVGIDAADLVAVRVIVRVSRDERGN